MSGEISTTFRDTEGRSWTIKVTYATLNRVQGETGVDLTKILDPKHPATDEALQDPVMFFRVICAALRPDLSARGVTDDRFGESLTEGEAEAAGLALYQSVIDFFRGPKRATLSAGFRKWTEAAQRHRDKATQVIGNVIDRMTPDEIESHLTGGDSAADSQESLGSTPTPELSANST